MTKKRSAARILALTMAMLTLLSLAACNGTATPEKVKLTNVFSSVTVPIDGNMQNIDRMTLAGETIYFVGYSNTQVDGEYIYSNALYSMNFDGTNLQKLIEMENQNDYEKQIYRSSYIQQMAADLEGNLWIVQQEYYNDYSDPENQINENKMMIKKLSPSGEVIAEMDGNSLVKEGEYFYIQSLAFDGDGNLFIAGDMSVYALDSKTAQLMYKLENENYINGLTRTGKGEIFVMTWGENGLILKKIDNAKKGWGESVDLGNSSMYNLIPGSGEYDFYYQDSTAILGYKMDTKESVEVLNWINSDIDSSRISNIATLPDGRMMGVEYNEDYSKPSLIMLTRKPDAEIKEAIMLTYATMYMGSDVRSAIIKFNRSQEDYRIQVIDYSKYATTDWNAGYDKLNLDIISGNIPDIVNLEGLNVSNFINKGLLADIYTMLDSDPDLSRDDFLTNVLEAGAQNGKLYRLIPTFYIYSVAAKTSLVGGTPGWTMDDLNNLMAGMPEDTVAFADMTKSNILAYSTYMAMDQFIDNDTGKCSFNSEAFIKLLEFANSFQTEIDWEAVYGQDNWWEAQQNAYKEDRTLLMQTYIYNVRSVREAKEQFDAPITYIGFPTANKNGSCIVPMMELAISAKSKNKDAAWQFLRTFLLEETYAGNNYFWGLTLNKNVINQKLEAEKVPYYDRSENTGEGGVVISRTYGSATSSRVIVSSSNTKETDWDDYYKNYHLTDDECNQIMSLITSVNRLMYRDAEISEIITAEVDYYFNGDKSAAAVADIIQNKIQTYISESR